jgi:hypothetical protein
MTGFDKPLHSKKGSGFKRLVGKGATGMVFPNGFTNYPSLNVPGIFSSFGLVTTAIQEG